VPLDVHLVTPEREVWSGAAEMVIARGVDGEVGILTGHAPLLIQLEIAPFRVQREGGEWVRAVVDGGFLHVTSEGGETRVDVLATGAELADGEDLDAAHARKQEAEQALSGRGSDQEDPEAEAARMELRKADVRLALKD
jgi:F-type H+-transporting ATPase subunit epsilon